MTVRGLVRPGVFPFAATPSSAAAAVALGRADRPGLRQSQAAWLWTRAAAIRRRRTVAGDRALAAAWRRGRLGGGPPPVRPSPPAGPPWLRLRPAGRRARRCTKGGSAGRGGGCAHQRQHPGIPTSRFDRYEDVMHRAVEELGRVMRPPPRAAVCSAGRRRVLIPVGSSGGLPRLRRGVRDGIDQRLDRRPHAALRRLSAGGPRALPGSMAADGRDSDLGAERGR